MTTEPTQLHHGKAFHKKMQADWLKTARFNSPLIEICVPVAELIRDKNTPSLQDDCPPTTGVGKTIKNSPHRRGGG